MAITLSDDAMKTLHASIKRYVAENFDEEIGDLKTGLFLDYCLREIGPTIYNQAIADAQAYFQARTADLADVCYRKEFAYWTPAPTTRQDNSRS